MRRLFLILAVFAATMGGILLAERLLKWPSWQIVPLILLAGAMLGVALMGRGLSPFRKRYLWARAMADGLAASAIVLPPFVLGLFILARLTPRFSVNFSVPPALGWFIIYQLFFVAVPEELFFRRVLQERLDNVFGTRWSFLKIRFGAGLFVAAALFALAHYIIRQDVSALAVFFPGLLFGLLYEKRLSIVGPVVCHVACNLAWAVFS